jgi:hypothetical protein
MTNWKVVGAAIDPPVPRDELDRIIPLLENLEAAFRAHQARIPVDGLMWTDPGDEE